MLRSKANIEIVKGGFETAAEIMIAVNLELAVIKGNKNKINYYRVSQIT